MTQYDNTNRGAIFPNDSADHPNAPLMKGPINVAGVEYQIAAWKNESKDGKKYLSLKVEPQLSKASATTAKAPEAEEDLPF